MKPFKLRIEKEFDTEQERDIFESEIRKWVKKWDMEN